VTLKELCERLELEPRQVRYLIAEGIMPPAAKLGVAADGYGEEHLRRGELFKRLHAEGLGVRAIAAELSVLARRAGLELRIIDAEAFASASHEQVAAFLREAKKALNSLREKQTDRS
jgi:DNA-binding transcriptional MerR regulator